MRAISFPVLLAAVLSSSTVEGQVRIRIKSDPPPARKPAQQHKPQKRGRTDAREQRWAQETAALWAQIRRISLDEDPRYKDRTLRWLKRGESKHAYKIVGHGGEVRYAARPPENAIDVAELFQRRNPGYTVMEYGARNRLHAWVWVRMSWIAEDEKWVVGSGLKHRFLAEDRLYRKWYSKVLSGPSVKASHLSRLSKSVIQSMSGVRTSRENLQKLRTGRTRSLRGNANAIETRTKTLAISEKALREKRAKLEAGLRAAGQRLGVGAVMWECERDRLKIAVAKWDAHMAEGRMRAFASRARSKPELASDFEDARADWERKIREAQSLRRQRRAAMARISAAVAASVPATPGK